jgi:hypothetical protein
MRNICRDLCKNHKYPKEDITTRNIKCWELKGFIFCTNCDIYLSRDKYLHEIRCRCCNGKLKIKPGNIRKRRGPRIIDYSKRYCIECGSTTTYVHINKEGKSSIRWYKFLDGYSCYSCHTKRTYKIKKLREKELVIYNK